MQLYPELYILPIILISYFYLVIYQYFTHKKCNYLHETGVAMILGVIGGIIIYFSDPDFFQGQKFDQMFRNVIILLLLPPMLFQDGYNIPKRKFFQNIFYINMYGIFGTAFNFFAIFGIIYAFNSSGLITLVWRHQTINLSNFQIMLFSTVLCSIDTVVPEKIVNPQRFPKLFSIIFGESIMKDTITFTLVSALEIIYNNSGTNRDLNSDDIGVIFLYFIIVVFGSIIIGIVCALITTLLFKNCRFMLHEEGIAQIGLTLLTGYGAYILGEMLQLSGVICMLFCGITLSHFNSYNLTKNGKMATKFSVTTLASISQGILFFLLGAFILNIQVDEINNEETGTNDLYYSFSVVFVCIGFLSLFIGRVLNIFLVTLIGKFLLGKKWKLNLYEYQILYVSGLVKGAVPFALILTAPTTSGSSQIATQSMINTVIIIVFITSLFINSLMPKILRNRLKKIQLLMRTNPNHPSVFDSILYAYASFAKKHPDLSEKKNGNCASEQYKEIQVEEISLVAKFKNTTYKYWRKCEQGFLKPHLIYDYHNRKEQIKREKKAQRKKECEEFWEQYYAESLMSQSEKSYNQQIDNFIIENDQQFEQIKDDSSEQRPTIELKERKYHSEQYSLRDSFMHQKLGRKSETIKT